MSAASKRPPQRRLLDVLDAITAIRSHMGRGDVTDGLIYDAVRMRTMEIGEALKAVPVELLATEPDMPWLEVKRTRDPWPIATSSTT